ncbi:MAG: serine hydrolase domain-containing protein [Actinomycetota bacterium]
MRRALSILLSLIILATACTRDVHAGPDQARGPSCDPTIDAAIRNWEAAGFSGSVAFLGGDRDCVAAYGQADPAAGRAMTTDTVFSIGSITKAVVAAAIGSLEADGRLTYDQPVGDLVPGLIGPIGETTVEQLLLHTGGVTGNHGRDLEPLDRDRALAALAGLDRAAAPGSEFLYSNAGYTALALVIDELTGDYRTYLTDRILTDGATNIGGFWNGEPAAAGPRAVGTTSTGQPGADGSFGGPHWGLDGSGGVAMTAEQLANWTMRLFAGDILAPDALERLLSLRFDQGYGSVEVPGWVSLDGAVFGEPVFGTAGGGSDIGHTMTVAWLPESGRVYSIATNSAEADAEAVLADLLPDLVAGRSPTGPAVADGGLNPVVAEAVTGRWTVADGARVEVFQDGDAVVVQAIDPAAVPMVLPVPDPEAAAAHEAAVLNVVAGSTEEGRRERALLEDSFGPIEAIEVFGTWFADIEYRTYLSIRFAAEEVLVWLAVDGRGGIAAAEVGTPPPSRSFIQRPDGWLAPIDPASEAVDLRIRFVDMGLEIVNGSAIELAERVG